MFGSSGVFGAGVLGAGGAGVVLVLVLLLEPLFAVVFFDAVELAAEPLPLFDLADGIEASNGVTLIRIDAYVTPGAALWARAASGRFGSASLRTR